MSRDWEELERLAYGEDADHHHKRLDPKDCGCTDCLIGWSVPWVGASADELERCIRGEIDNASNCSFIELFARLEYLERRIR